MGEAPADTVHAGAEPPKAGGFRTGPVVTIGAIHAIHDTYTGFLPSLLPVFIQRLLLSKTEAGLLTVFIQGPSLLQPFIGHTADRVSLRYLVILAPAATAIAMSLLGVAPRYGLMAALLLLAGLSAACIHSVGPVMAGRLAGDRLGRAMGIWMVGGELGRVLGPIVIVTALAAVPLRETPWLMIGGIAASLVLYLRLRDVPDAPPDSRRSMPWRSALRAMRPLLLPLTGVIVARAFLLSAITTFLPTFLSEEGVGIWMAGASLSIVEAAGVAGALVGGSVSDRLGRRRVMAISMGGTSVFMFAFLLVEGAARLPFLVLMGFGGLAVTPVIMAMVQERFPENRALANGLYMALSFGLRAVVVVLVGALGDLIGLRAAFTVSAILPVVGLPLVALLPARHRAAGRPAP